ncbi:hypothetical protein [Tropicibacter sp. S64]|uniref:hypothetical protein n=1 Tax=Tropicibacter sp. S64 TaxID=3415122 RepID=UPI003C7E77BD
MSDFLTTDTLLSVLAGLSLFALRTALPDAPLDRWLTRTLRFGALVLGMFYLLRPLAWYGAGALADRVILVVATLTALAILLIAEAAVKRHAPRALKLGVAGAVPLLIVGALVVPQSLGPAYLAALLAFQIVVLAFGGWMLWTGSHAADGADRRTLRFFAVLILLCLPLIAAESALLNTDGALHISALAVLFGVWLLFNLPHWTLQPWRLVSWTAGGLSLAILTALALVSETGGTSLTDTALGLSAMLIFASILSSVQSRRGSALEMRLADLLERPDTSFGLDEVMEALHEHHVAQVPASVSAAADGPALRAMLAERPVWAGPGSHTHRDADEALSDIARTTGASHLLCVGTTPLRLIALNLGPADATRQVSSLLVVLCRRLGCGASA